MLNLIFIFIISINPFEFVHENKISAAFNYLDSIEETGEISREELYLQAKLFLSIGEIDKSLNILNTLLISSDIDDAVKFLTQRELNIWQSNDFFSKDTIYYTDSLFNNYLIRNIKIFIPHEILDFSIEYNPLYTLLEIKKSYSESMSPGTYFKQKIISPNIYTGGLTKFYFIPSVNGTYLHLSLVYADLLSVPTVEGYLNKIISYQIFNFSDKNIEIVHDHFEVLENVFIGSKDFPSKEVNSWNNKNPWLHFSLFNTWSELSDTIRNRILKISGHSLPSDPLKLFKYLEENFNVISIPYGNYTTRPVELCLSLENASELEIINIVYNTLKDKFSIKLYLVSSRINNSKYSIIPSMYFDKILLYIDDISLWFDPSLKTPYNYIPGEFQFSPAIELSNGIFDTIPWLSANESSFEIIQNIKISNNKIELNTSLTLSGEFLIKLSDVENIDTYFKDMILKDFPFSFDINIERDRNINKETINIIFSYPIIEYSENYYLIKILRFPEFIEIFSPVYINNKLQFISSNKINQKIRIIGDSIDLLSEEISLSESWGNLYLKYNKYSDSIIIYSEVVNWGKSIQNWNVESYKKFNEVMEEKVFPEFLIFKI